MKSIKKDECSYSVSNAIRTLVMKLDFNLDIFSSDLITTS